MNPNFWAEKNVLVTGGAGFIGSHLVDRLIQLGANVTVVDNFSKGKMDNIFHILTKNGISFEDSVHMNMIKAGKHKIVLADLEDKAVVAKIVRGQEIVFHTAAIIGGRGYIDTHPADSMRNLVINHNVIHESFEAGVERVHYSSTACVYPTKLQADYGSDYLLKEDDAIVNNMANCDGEYGWTKFMGELGLQAYYKQYGMKGSICRYVTAYGEREDDTHALMALVRKALEKQDPYVVWGTGEQDRDFTYVGDIADGSILAAEKITDCTPINLGTSVRYKIKDVANSILKLANHAPLKGIFFDTTKPEGVKSRALDIMRAKKLLGWEPKVSLEEGIKRVVNWHIQAKPQKVETLE